MWRMFTNTLRRIDLRDRKTGSAESVGADWRRIAQLAVKRAAYFLRESTQTARRGGERVVGQVQSHFTAFQTGIQFVPVHNIGELIFGK